MPRIVAKRSSSWQPVQSNMRIPERHNSNTKLTQKFPRNVPPATQTPELRSLRHMKQLDAGDKPSTLFVPGGLVNLSIVGRTTIQCKEIHPSRIQSRPSSRKKHLHHNIFNWKWNSRTTSPNHQEHSERLELPSDDSNVRTSIFGTCRCHHLFNISAQQKHVRETSLHEFSRSWPLVVIKLRRSISCCVTYHRKILDAGDKPSTCSRREDS